MSRIQCKRRLLIAMSLIFLVAACGETEKVITVGDFAHDPELFKKTKMECLSGDASKPSSKCINAKEAARVVSVDNDCYKGNGGHGGKGWDANDKVDHACLDAKGYKRSQ